MKQPLFRNKKTGNLYVIEAIAIDATNERDGNQVVVYHPVGNRNDVFVRDEAEFKEKFEEVVE
jgi:hypothetical protein